MKARFGWYRRTIVERVTRHDECCNRRGLNSHLQYSIVRETPFCAGGETNKLTPGWAAWHRPRLERSIESQLVGEGLKATEDCWMYTLESRCKTADAIFRILSNLGENGEVFHSMKASLPRLAFEVRVHSFEANEPTLDSADGSAILSPVR